MKTFVFKEEIDGSLTFHGDFEGLYQQDDDPWGQSGKDRIEYNISRQRQLEILGASHAKGSLLDLGCGLGYSTKFYSKRFASTGVDISRVAIEKASQKFPNVEFQCHDIRKPLQVSKRFDVVVLNQVLWYVLPDLSDVFNHIDGLLEDNGVLLISQFLLEKSAQKFGRNYFSGHTECPVFLEKAASPKLIIDQYHCFQIDLKYFDFHCTLKRAKK